MKLLILSKNPKNRQNIRVAALAVFCLTTIASSASATTSYHYTIDPGQTLTAIHFPGDPIGNRGHFTFDLEVILFELTYRDGNIWIESDLQGHFNTNQSAPRSTLFGINQEVNNRWHLSAHYINAELLGEQEFVVRPGSGGSGTSTLNVTTGSITWLNGTGQQSFVSANSGTPLPNPYADFDSYSLAFQDGLLTGWIAAAISQATGLPFAQGDFFAPLRFVGAEGISREVPEPASIALLAGAIAGAAGIRRGRRKPVEA